MSINYQEILQFLKTGECLQAQQYLTPLLETHLENATLWGLQAAVYMQTGASEKGVNAFQQAYQFLPSDDNADNWLLSTLQWGHLDSILSCWESLSHVQRQNPQYLNAIEKVLFQSGYMTWMWSEQEKQTQQVKSLLEQITAQAPEHLRAQLVLGKILTEAAAFDLATTCFKAYFEAHTENPWQAFSMLATQAFNNQKFAAAAFYSWVVLQQIPENLPRSQRANLYALAAEYYGVYGHTEQAVTYYRKAREIQGDKLAYAMEETLLIPSIYTDEAHIISTRRKLKHNLNKVYERFKQRLSNQSPLPPLQIKYPFYLAYQGKSDREIVSKLGDFYVDLLQRAGLYKTCEHRPFGNSKIRIGVVSAFFYNHSISFCYEGMLAYLARQHDVELTIYYVGQKVDDVTQSFQKMSHRFVQSKDVEKIKTKVLEHQQDILLYTDIGMSSRTYGLALHRLAPIQMVTGGHPVTTGLPNMDYCIINKKGLTPQSLKAYRETLAAMPQSISISPPLPSLEKTSRKSLGWTEHEHIYFCPMTLFKVHPDTDDFIQYVLENDEKACFYFAKDKNYRHAELLQARWNKRFSASQKKRIRWMDWLSKTRFFQALDLADLVFETPHFGAGTTARMVLGIDRFLLCFPSVYYRGRIASVAYEQMNLAHLLPKTKEEAYKMAVKVAQNKAYKKSIESLIKDNKHLLFNDKNRAEPLYAFIQALKSKDEETLLKYVL